MTARDILTETFSASLPEGSPLPFSQIVTARFDGKSSIVADLIMFDGLPAVARLNRWAMGWSLGYDTMQGGDISLDNGKWARVFPQQDLFAERIAS